MEGYKFLIHIGCNIRGGARAQMLQDTWSVTSKVKHTSKIAQLASKLII